MITAAREAVDLLLQAGNSWYFEGTRHGMRDQEWVALRFLARANRFSRPPSSLAKFVGTTRATVSEMVKRLEAKGYLERKSSGEDKRSVILCITLRGEKILAHDPIAPLVSAIAMVELGAPNFRDTLRKVLDRLGTAQHRHHADSCRQCIFLSETSMATAESTCRFFRAAITKEEIDLLCFNFERRGGRIRS
ncbi:MarR family transcriptional repressor of emrRAB [Bradyrhizobium sp. RT9a]